MSWVKFARVMPFWFKVVLILLAVFDIVCTISVVAQEKASVFQVLSVTLCGIVIIGLLRGVNREAK